MAELGRAMRADVELECRESGNVMPLDGSYRQWGATERVKAVM